eukprot:SAG25_NODE_763_length_5504_cov_4.689362_8_plen_166_part_00
MIIRRVRPDSRRGVKHPRPASTIIGILWSTSTSATSQPCATSTARPPSWCRACITQRPSGTPPPLRAAKHTPVTIQPVRPGSVGAAKHPRPASPSTARKSERAASRHHHGRSDRARPTYRHHHRLLSGLHTPARHTSSISPPHRRSSSQLTASRASSIAPASSAS